MSLNHFPIVLMAVSGALFLGCSTLPPKPVEQPLTEHRDQAADYAKLGDENLRSRNYTQAETYYQQALDANWAVDNLNGVVESHLSLGYLYLGLGRLDAAEQEDRQAGEAADILGDTALQNKCKVSLARIALAQSKQDDALALLEPMVTGPGAAADDLAGSIWMNLGIAYKDAGKIAEARSALDKSLNIYVALKAIRERAGVLYLKASLENAQGRRRTALTLLSQALEFDHQAEHSEGIAADLYALAIIWQRVASGDSGSESTPAESGIVPADKKLSPIDLSLGAKSPLEKSWDLMRRSFRVSLAIDDAQSVERCLTKLQEIAHALGKTDDEASYATMYQRLRSSQDGANSADQSGAR